MKRILVLIFILTLAVAAFMVVESPQFRLQELAVEGLEELAPEEIWSLSQLRAGDHLWSVNLSAIEEMVEAHPRIRSAEVERLHPGRLVFRVEERRGVLLVPHHQGFLEICTDGWALAWHESPIETQLPVATGLNLGDLVVGERAIAEGLQECLELSAALGQARRELSEINVSSGILTMYTVDGTSVLWGQVWEDFEEKTEVLKAFLLDPQPGIRYLDIRVASLPVMGE